jgi:hypothetical protein
MHPASASRRGLATVVRSVLLAGAGLLGGWTVCLLVVVGGAVLQDHLVPSAASVSTAVVAGAVLVSCCLVSKGRLRETRYTLGAALAGLALAGVVLRLGGRTESSSVAPLVETVLLEELMFRVLPVALCALLFRGRHVRTTVVLAAVAFLATHALDTPALVLNKMAFAGILALLVLTTGSAALCLSVHLLSNTLWIAQPALMPVTTALVADAVLLLLAAGTCLFLPRHRAPEESSKSPMPPTSRPWFNEKRAPQPTSEGAPHD